MMIESFIANIAEKVKSELEEKGLVHRPCFGFYEGEMSFTAIIVFNRKSTDKYYYMISISNIPHFEFEGSDLYVEITLNDPQLINWPTVAVTFYSANKKKTKAEFQIDEKENIVKHIINLTKEVIND